jgi:hypothetical protein
MSKNPQVHNLSRIGKTVCGQFYLAPLRKSYKSGIGKPIVLELAVHKKVKEFGGKARLRA